MPAYPRDRRGFTMVEMLVIIGIVGLIAAIAVPGFSSYLRSNRLVTSADRVAADMNFTRTLAIAQGRVLQFVGSAGGYQVIDPMDASIVRDRTFEGSVQLDAAYTINFFPWGAAESNTLTLGAGADSCSVVVLPTGVAEVH